MVKSFLTLGTIRKAFETRNNTMGQIASRG